MRRLTRISGGTGVALAALAVFVILWFPILTGQRVLLGGDVLYLLLPWSAEPGAHAAANTIVSDTLAQDLPWQTLIARDIANGELPLWNPSIESGVPVLANDQAGVFSIFSWLAMPFTPAVGLSIAMLVKLLVAGFGMAFYLRMLKANGPASALAGIAFATSSFMVDWLAWPLASVACFMPWMFGFVEAYLAQNRRWALAGLAVAVCLQFFGGHAETSFHMGLAIGLYALIRWAFLGHRWRAIGALAAAVVVGTLLAGIQLVPFVDLLRRAQLISVRTSSGLGFAHLSLASMSTWIFPNALGNPAIDGGTGHAPNFNESTGYATVAALVLSPLGVWWAWTRDRSVAFALGAIGLVSAGIVYGPLSPVSGRLPGFGVSNNQRALVVLCFCVAALGGLGLDALMRGEVSVPRLPARLLLWAGAAGLGAVVAISLLVALRGGRVDSYLPHVQDYIGFWLLAGFVSLGTGAAFVLAGLARGAKTWAAAGLCGLALVEGAVYAGTYNPREPLSEVPPPSPAVAFLTAHAGGQPVAALGTTLFPETALLYGLSDVRGYEILTDPRVRAYWAAADPGYDDSRVVTMLDRPGAAWLAAAGVAYVMMPADRTIPGTTEVYRDAGVVIAEVPNPRPFAYAASAVTVASSQAGAVATLSADPMGAVVVEGGTNDVASADVEVTKRSANSFELRVTASGQATIVLEQSYQAGWQAAIDGGQTTIRPSDVLFQSVSVPAGTHTVSFKYEPSSVLAGWVTSLAGALGLLLLLGLALVPRLRA